MSVRITISAGALFLVSASSSATVPHPPPPKFVESWKAIEALGPFVGEWHGTETQHVKSAGDFSQFVFWRLSRPGNQDVVLLEHGYESETPSSGRESDKPHTDQVNMLTFSPDEHRYRIFVAGYRLFRDSDSTGQLLDVEKPGADTLGWVSAQNNGGGRKTTLSIRSGKLVETVDQLSPEGVARRISDAQLTK